MQKIKGIKIDKLPFENLTLKSTLIDFEGVDILNHYKDHTKSDILKYLVDYENTISRYVFISIKEDTLYEFINKKITIRQILLNTKFFFVEDYNYNNENYIYNLIYNKLPSNYLPNNNSYCHYIPNYYKNLIEKNKLK
jgi:hypothetical protein